MPLKDIAPLKYGEDILTKYSNSKTLMGIGEVWFDSCSGPPGVMKFPFL